MKQFQRGMKGLHSSRMSMAILGLAVSALRAPGVFPGGSDGCQDFQGSQAACGSAKALLAGSRQPIKRFGVNGLHCNLMAKLSKYFAVQSGCNALIPGHLRSAPFLRLVLACMQKL